MDRYLETNLESIMSTIEELKEMLMHLKIETNKVDRNKIVDNVINKLYNIDTNRYNIYCKLEGMNLTDKDIKDDDVLIKDYQLEFLLQHLKDTTSYEDNNYYLTKYKLPKE